MQKKQSGDLIKHTGKTENGIFNKKFKGRGTKIRVGRVIRTTYIFCFGLM